MSLSRRLAVYHPGASPERDIDLLVQAGSVIPDLRRKSLKLAARLQMRLGDRPIDVVVVDPETPIGPVQASAIRTGQKL